jgi:phosphoribosyl-dephospho-CoA transferase
VSELELIYAFEIPEELFDRTDLTLGQFNSEPSQIPLISENEYSEFLDIKLTSMKLTKRFIELESETDVESICELDEINNKFEELTERLNVLLGNILIN